MPDRTPSRVPLRHLLAVAGAVFVFLFARAMMRFHDLDEHQFVAPPALLVQEGLLPYADYPYFHMPTLIYAQGVLLACCSWPLLAARTLSVACGTATVLLLFCHGWRLLAGVPTARHWLLSGGPCLVFLTSRLFTYTNGWAWNHDAATLCMLGALLLNLRGLERGRVAPIALAGLLFGLAAGVRLSFALAFVPLAASVCLSRSPLTRRQRAVAVSLAALAAVVALLPAVVHLARHRDAFLFGNLGYARLNTEFYARSSSAAISLPGKAYHLAQTFLTDPGNAVLLLLAVAGAWRAPRWVVLGLLPFLLIGAWGPSPTQYQYYYMLLPFLLVTAQYGVAAASTDPAAERRWRRLVWLGVLVAALPGLPRWYWHVVYLPRPDAWVPVRVHRMGEWVREHVPDSGRVLTLEPGVPLEAGVRVYPEYTVGRFVMHVGELMTSPQRSRYGMAWGEQLDELLRQRPPEAVLVQRRIEHLAVPLREYAYRNGFELHRSPDGQYDLWVRPAGVTTARR